jgi:hypothetical protein
LYHISLSFGTSVLHQTGPRTKKLASNPDLGAYRVMAALEQIGIKLSQRTCGRLLALNRGLYGIEIPKGTPHQKKDMPFKATFRHEYWSVDVRYIEEHRVQDMNSGPPNQALAWQRIPAVVYS